MTTHGRGSNTESSHSFQSMPFQHLFYQFLHLKTTNEKRQVMSAPNQNEWRTVCFLTYCYIYLTVAAAANTVFASNHVLIFCLYLFPGMGYASQLILFYGCISYVVILAWAFHYLFSSFSWDLPWSTCNNTWNTGSVRVPYTARKLCNEKNEFNKAEILQNHVWY